MGIAIVAVLAVISIAAIFFWVVRNPGPETEQGIENRARREAKRAAQDSAVAGRSEG